MDLGWQLLRGTHYLLCRMDKPFDATALMQDGVAARPASERTSSQRAARWLGEALSLRQR